MKPGDGALDVPALPAFVQIEPVGQCNLACRMCPVVFRENERRPAFMAFDDFLRLLDGFPGVRELHLQGLGEPLLHPRFFDMVRAAADRGIEVSTNTNLTALSARRTAELARCGLARVHVSLDAPEAQSYEYIRTGARFEQVMRNLRRLVAARGEAGARPEIHLVAVAMRRNLEALPGLVALAHELGLQGVSVQHLAHDFTESTLPERYRPMRRFVDAESLAAAPPGDVERVFAAMRSRAQALGVPLRLPALARVSGRPRGCDWPWRGAYVAYTGEAMPCCMVATPDRVNFGNMAKDGVAAVWSGASYADFRARLASEEPPEICRGCALYHGAF